MATGYGTGLCLAVPVDGNNVPQSIFYKDHHTLSEIEDMIRSKVMAKNRDQLWSELDYLFSRKPKITQSEFRKHIFHMGVELSKEACAALFKKYDKDNSGSIDADEYAAALLLDLPQASRKNYERREAQIKQERKTLDSKFGKATSWQDNPDVVEKLIREKIATMTSKSSDQIRQALKIFGGKTALPLEGFRRVVKKLGIEASAAVTATLFQRYDIDGNQELDLYEFVRGLMPQDLTAETFNVTAEKERKKVEEDFKRNALLPQMMPQHLEKWKKGPEELERLLVEKLEQRVSTKAKQLGCRQAFRLFSKDGQTQITRAEFLGGLRRLGFILSPDECNTLFQRYDSKRDGVIDYDEFRMGLFPLEGDAHNKNVHRKLVRDEIVDPVPMMSVDAEPPNPAYAAMDRHEAQRQAELRLKKGPLYYSAVPSRKAMRVQRIPANHTPPTFTSVPLLKKGQEEHYFSGVNTTSKVYNSYFPPSTATRSKPPWAHTEKRFISSGVGGGRSQSMLSHRSARSGISLLGPNDRRDMRSASARGGNSLLGAPMGGDVFGGATL